MNTNEATLAQLVDPQYPLNVVGLGGFRGGHLDQLKPLTVRVTDHRDDLGGDQNDPLVPRDNFAIFESCAAGQPWKKVDMSTHIIHQQQALSEIFAQTRTYPGTTQTAMSIRFDVCVVGETVGIAYQDTTQPSPFLAPYVIASTDPVAEALAYQTFVDASTVAIKASIDPNDPTRVFFYANTGYEIWVTYGFAIPAVTVIPDNADTYYPYYNYSHFG